MAERVSSVCFCRVGVSCRVHKNVLFRLRRYTVRHVAGSWLFSGGHRGVVRYR